MYWNNIAPHSILSILIFFPLLSQNCIEMERHWLIYNFYHRDNKTPLCKHWSLVLLYVCFVCAWNWIWFKCKFNTHNYCLHFILIYIKNTIVFINNLFVIQLPEWGSCLIHNSNYSQIINLTRFLSALSSVTYACKYILKLMIIWI